MSEPRYPGDPGLPKARYPRRTGDRTLRTFLTVVGAVVALVAAGCCCWTGLVQSVVGEDLVEEVERARAETRRRAEEYQRRQQAGTDEADAAPASGGGLPVRRGLIRDTAPPDAAETDGEAGDPGDPGARPGVDMEPAPPSPPPKPAPPPRGPSESELFGVD